jgi:hypothetical protein
VKAGGFETRDAIRKAYRDHVSCDVGGVLLMMAERGHRIFGRGSAMWVCHRAQCRVSDRSKVERKQALASQLQIVKRGNLHDEIMGMLSVGNWLSEGRFSLLEQ